MLTGLLPFRSKPLAALANALTLDQHCNMPSVLASALRLWVCCVVLHMVLASVAYLHLDFCVPLTKH